MVKRPVLGRGLAALLGEAEEGGTLIDSGGSAQGVESGGTGPTGEALRAGTVVDLPVAVIRRNPRQPRRSFDTESLQELATSIGAVGVVQPVIVREVEGAYELIAGERRWRAAQIAGYTVIPAIIRSASDTESLELALVENVVRQQLNPVDEALALKVLLEDLGVTQDNLAARVGKSRSAIANKIRLLDLPAQIQESLAAGAISEGHGRALLGVSGRADQLRLARRAAEKGLSVRQVEDEVRRLSSKSGSKGRDKEQNTAPPAEAIDAETVDYVRELVLAALGVVPRVKTMGGGGVIEVPFKDTQELTGIIERLGHVGDR